MAKKKDAEAPAEAEAAAPAKLTQREAVEKALAAGKELPVDGVPYVQKEFGIELSKQAFSTIKSKINKVGGTAPKKRGRPAASSNGTVAHKPATRASATAANPADLARQVKALIGAYGAVAVSDMVAVFAE